MRRIHRYALLALSAGLLAACGKSQISNDAPLAFVPADTPYVYANLEPTPPAVIEQWSKRMHEYWPALFGMYDNLLTQISKNADTKPESAHALKIARVLLDELKTHDDWDKLRQIGFKPDARAALYGIGMVPVLRLELGDVAAFKAEVAHLEDKVGEKIPVAKTGDQEYWQLGNDKLAVAVAIQGTHLVATLLPTNADDALKQTLLGIVRPAQNLAAAGTLQALAKQYGYSPYGEAYVDVVRITERLSGTPSGSDADFAKALGLPVAPASDAVCQAEFLQIAHKFPRLVAGVAELGPQRIRVAAQLEIEQTLAQQIAAAVGAAPGTGAPGEGVIDVSLALPVLKLKDFWMKQADAVAAKPYACASLASLNDSFRQSREKIDVTVPPPFSDLTGVRFTLDKFEMNSASTIPDVAGKMLMASSNPMAVVAMASLAAPALKDFKVGADGKPVPLPAGIAPPGVPPLFAAMSGKALALAAGAGEDAGLTAYLNAPAAGDAVFMRMYFSGKFYSMLAQSFDRLKVALPADKQAQMDQQKQLLAMYEKWLRSGEITLVATASGIAMRETVEQN